MMIFDKCSELGLAVKDEMLKYALPSLQDQEYGIHMKNILLFTSTTCPTFTYTHLSEAGGVSIQSLILKW